jgi:hypothetical protein
MAQADAEPTGERGGVERRAAGSFAHRCRQQTARAAWGKANPEHAGQTGGPQQQWPGDLSLKKTSRLEAPLGFVAALEGVREVGDWLGGAVGYDALHALRLGAVALQNPIGLHEIASQSGGRISR